MKETLEKAAQTVLEWGILTPITYDTSKTEAELFSKSHRQRMNKQLQEAKIKFGNERIPFDKEATRWLGVWLNS